MIASAALQPLTTNGTPSLNICWATVFLLGRPWTSPFITLSCHTSVRLGVGAAYYMTEWVFSFTNTQSLVKTSLLVLVSQLGDGDPLGSPGSGTTYTWQQARRCWEM